MGIKLLALGLFVLLFAIGIVFMTEPAWALQFFSNPHKLTVGQTAKVGTIVTLIATGLAALILTAFTIPSDDPWEDEKHLDLD